MRHHDDATVSHDGGIQQAAGATPSTEKKFVVARAAPSLTASPRPVRVTDNGQSTAASPSNASALCQSKKSGIETYSFCRPVSAY
jgi:hypothetical protein